MEEKNSPYRLVACGFVDLIEAHATRRTIGAIVFEDNGIERTVLDGVLDRYTKNGEEFMVTLGGHTIRLDRILLLFGEPIQWSC
jgi:hypothetical protein